MNQITGGVWLMSQYYMDSNGNVGPYNYYIDGYYSPLNGITAVANDENIWNSYMKGTLSYGRVSAASAAINVRFGYGASLVRMPTANEIKELIQTNPAWAYGDGSGTKFNKEIVTGVTSDVSSYQRTTFYWHYNPSNNGFTSHGASRHISSSHIST